MLGARDGGRVGTTRVVAILVGITVFALLLRLWALGDRVAHWDEARIAFWVLQYGATGEWTYHPVFHGPLLFHVERWLFDVLEPSDFVMRLPTVIVGGLLPLAAWLFRDHLEDREVLAMAVLLAANPILVYYSRFMRNDILVAAFALVGFGFGLRWLATGRLRYALGIGVVLGAALGSKENALLYLLAWIGAGVLLVVTRAHIEFGEWGVKAGVAPSGASTVKTIRHGLVAGLAALPVIFWIYAPRGSGPDTLGQLGTGLGAIPTVLDAAILHPPAQAISFWALGSAQSEYPYYVFFGLLVGILLVGATATVLAAIVGLRRHRNRPIVAFAGFWAGLSVIGYPAAADLMAGWTVLHVVIPLIIPAAVGLVSLLRTPAKPGRLLPSRRPVVGLVGVYLVVAIALTSFVGAGSIYNPIGQPSQMDAGATETVASMETALADGGSVTYVGPYWESIVHRLPILWYVEKAGADRQFVDSVSEVGAEPPPVLITHTNRTGAVQHRYPEYDCTAHERVPWAGGRPEGLPGEMLVCVDSG